MFLRTMVEGLYVGKAQVTVRSVFVTFEGVPAGVQEPRKRPRCHVGRLDGQGPLPRTPRKHLSIQRILFVQVHITPQHRGSGAYGRSEFCVVSQVSCGLETHHLFKQAHDCPVSTQQHSIQLRWSASVGGYRLFELARPPQHPHCEGYRVWYERGRRW